MVRVKVIKVWFTSESVVY